MRTKSLLKCILPLLITQTAVVVIGLTVCGLRTAVAQQSPDQPPRDQLRQYVTELQKNPFDDKLRERIIKLALTLQPPPAVPPEADEFAGRGLSAFKQATSDSDFDGVALAFSKASSLAPWASDYYFNQAVAYEKAHKVDSAIKCFQWYLMAAPEAKDAKSIRVRIGALKFAAEKAAAPATNPQTSMSANAGTEPESAGAKRGVSAAPESKPGLGREQTGRFVALVIGINDYRYLPRLKTAVNDAEYIARTLHDLYGFETRILRNANRNDITKALNEYRRNLDESANFLVYYAGHGFYDKDADKAYWLPADAEPGDNSNWIIADDITTDIRVLPARHVLIISDSCYSGGITREVSPAFTPQERGRYLQKMIEGRSRTLMSSGGLEPVSDEGSDGHSVFASALLHGLTTTEDQAFSAENLFQQFIRVPVAGKSEQTPQYGAIRNSGHDSGDFVFVRAVH